MAADWDWTCGETMLRAGRSLAPHRQGDAVEGPAWRTLAEDAVSAVRNTLRRRRS